MVQPSDNLPMRGLLYLHPPRESIVLKVVLNAYYVIFTLNYAISTYQRCRGGPESGSGGQGLGVDLKVRGQTIGEDWKESHFLPLSTEHFCFHAIYFIFN